MNFASADYYFDVVRVSGELPEIVVTHADCIPPAYTARSGDASGVFKNNNDNDDDDDNNNNNK